MSGPIFYAVPVGTPPGICKGTGCGKRIYWVTTGYGKHMPVDCDVEGGKLPTRSEPGQGVPHWGTCPEATAFKRAKA